MDYAARLVVQLKNVFFFIFRNHSIIRNVLQVANFPTFLPKTIPLLIVTPQTQPFDISHLNWWNRHYMNYFPNEKHFYQQSLNALGQMLCVIARTNTVPKMSQLHISYIFIIKFMETLIILSTNLEITIDHQTSTNGDAVQSSRTFSPSVTTTDAELQEKKKKSLKFFVFQMFGKFKCEIISIV